MLPSNTLPSVLCLILLEFFPSTACCYSLHKAAAIENRGIYSHFIDAYNFQLKETIEQECLYCHNYRIAVLSSEIILYNGHYSL
jgi:hypothetical protein